MNYQDFSAVDEVETPFRDKPDGTVDPAGEAGWFLQRERERRGIEIEQAADEIGIHAYHLDAIECGDLRRLPARMETLKMAGLYAQYLGFDPEPLVYHYAALLPRQQAAVTIAHPANPEPLSSAKVIKFSKLSKLTRLRLGNFPGGAGGVVVSCLGAMLLFGGASWYLQPSADMTAKEQVAEAPANSAGLGDPIETSSTDGQTEAVKVTEEAMPDTKPAQAAKSPEQEWNVGEAADPSAAASPVDEPSPAAIPPQEDFGGMTEFIQDKVGVKPAKEKLPKAASKTQDAPKTIATGEEPKSRLVLKAKAPVWVRIEDAHGNVVMTQMLMKGDTYQVPAREGLVLIARDGGLLSYEIDGKERGILGPAGEILVGRPLDIKSLEGQG